MTPELQKSYDSGLPYPGVDHIHIREEGLLCHCGESLSINDYDRSRLWVLKHERECDQQVVKEGPI